MVGKLVWEVSLVGIEIWRYGYGDRYDGWWRWWPNGKWVMVWIWEKIGGTNNVAESGFSATHFSIAGLETGRFPRWWTVQACGWVDAKASLGIDQQVSHITLPVPNDTRTVTLDTARQPCKPSVGGGLGLRWKWIPFSWTTFSIIN